MKIEIEIEKIKKDEVVLRTPFGVGILPDGSTAHASVSIDGDLIIELNNKNKYAVKTKDLIIIINEKDKQSWKKQSLMVLSV